MKIDALFFLLLIEALAVLLALSAALAFQVRKTKTLRRAALRDLETAVRELKELKHLRAGPPAAAPAAAARTGAATAENELPAGSPDAIKRLKEEKETLAKKLGDAEKTAEERNRQLDGLQAKLDNLEKEYLILYRQQQQQSGGQQ